MSIHHILGMFQFNFHNKSEEDESKDLPALELEDSLSLPWQRKAQTEEERTLLKNERYKSLSWDDKWLASTKDLPISTADANVQYVWHFDMINDIPRNKAYHHAIGKVLREIREEIESDSSVTVTDKEYRDKNGVIDSATELHVLDVGTGSGLLALLAAKQGATCVTAVEVEAAVARVASINVRQNGMENVVTVQNGHSMTPSIQVPSPVHLIVTELLDTGLLGEAFIPVLRDAQSRGWMREGCRVIPARGRVFGQLVESEYMHHLAVLDPTKKGFGFQLPQKIDKSIGVGGVMSVDDDETISPFDCSFRHLLQNNQAKELSAPFVAWDFDFENLPPTDGRSRVLRIPATASGVVHAVLFWWEVGLDREGEFNLSSAASSPEGEGERRAEEGGEWRRHHRHQDHWIQAFTVMSPPVSCAKDQELQVNCFHNDENVWFNIHSIAKEESTSKHEKQIIGLVHSNTKKMKKLKRTTEISDLFDSERLFQMNNCQRNAAISHYIDVVLQKQFLPKMMKKEQVYCVALIGDGPLLPLVVANCFSNCLSSALTTKKEISNSGNINDKNYKIIHLEGNDDCQALSMKYLFSNGLYPPLVSSSTCDPAWALKSSSVNLLCAEPFFQPDAFCKTWGKSALIRYWLACYALTPYLAPDAQLLPGRAVLRVAAVECQALWQARSPCSGLVEGLDLSALNSLHSFNKTDSVPLWRYDHRFLSRPISVLDMNFWTNPGDVSLQTQQFQLEMTAPGVCHGLVMWIEYSSLACGREDGDSREEFTKEDVWCSTAAGPGPDLQGIRFCVRSVPVQTGDSIGCTAMLDVLGNDIDVSMVKESVCVQ